MERLPIFLCLLAFVVTFVATRGVTRMIRAGIGPFRNNVSSSGVHVHHAVPGVVLLVVGAFTAVGSGGEAGWAELAGILVGVGTALVLDEFALILHLDDVYWSEEGRVSVEMVALAAAVLGLALLGFRPFRFDGADDPVAVAVASIAVVMHLVWVAVCAAKGKYRLALFATFIPVIGPIGAIRLAHPASWWADRFYDADKTHRAEKRAETVDARRRRRFDWLADLVAGSPDDPRPVDAADVAATSSTGTGRSLIGPQRADQDRPTS